MLPLAEAQRLLNESIVHEYGKKGGKVVEMNQAVVNAVFAGDLPQEVQVPAAWANAVDTSTRTPTGIEFVDKIMRPLMDFKGDQLPVSVMTPGGTFPVGPMLILTCWEKRKKENVTSHHVCLGG